MKYPPKVASLLDILILRGSMLAILCVSWIDHSVCVGHAHPISKAGLARLANHTFDLLLDILWEDEEGFKWLRTQL